MGSSSIPNGEKALKLTEEQERILRAMYEMEGPITTKQISEATGLTSKSISCRIRSLKTKGLIESPARCKYEITDSGKAAVANQ